MMMTITGLKGRKEKNNPIQRAGLLQHYPLKTGSVPEQKESHARKEKKRKITRSRGPGYYNSTLLKEVPSPEPEESRIWKERWGYLSHIPWKEVGRVNEEN
ncbi:hypothetical protein Dimus_038905 [Dionaea muscipula]